MSEQESQFLTPSQESDEDSSAASSGDEILNIVIPFSQESRNGTEGKRCEKSPASNRESCDEENNGESKPRLSGKKRSRSIDESDCDLSENAVEIKARILANGPLMVSKIGTPDRLFWHERIYKRRKMLTPCRVCPTDEVIGLSLKKWDEETQHPIQYIQYPHKKVRDAATYTIAFKKALTPYYGESPTRDSWCPKRLNQYLKQTRKRHKFGALDCKTEEFFIERALKQSLQEEEAQNKFDEFDIQFVPPEVDPSTNNREQATTKGEEEEDPMEDRGPAFNSRRYSTGERSEPLRVGDRIAFYKPPYGAGDPRGYSEATVTHIDPRGDQIITIDNFFVQLEPTHKVKRIQRKHRGKLVDHKGQFRPINKYVLKKEGDPGGLRKALQKEKDRTSSIFQKNKNILKSTLEKDGSAPTDLIA